jgi:hypothetical protein
MRVYLDGAVDGTLAKTTEQVPANDEGAVWLGQGDQPKDRAWSNPYSWIGQLDEIRISRVARSADWIATEFNNQKPASIFYVVASEEGTGPVLRDGGPRRNVRSVAANAGVLHRTGTATVALGSTAVTFTSALPASVGRGDRLVLEPGTGNEETLFLVSVESATEATVQRPAGLAHGATPFEIRRAYTSLQAWEDDRDGDHVAENRREVGVVYSDGTQGPSRSTARRPTPSATCRHRRLQASTEAAGTGAVLAPRTNGHAVNVLVTTQVVGRDRS